MKLKSQIITAVGLRLITLLAFLAFAVGCHKTSRQTDKSKETTNESARGKDCWKLGGNSNTGGNFLGTSDKEALELRVNGMSAVRLEPTARAHTVNIIGGSSYNSVEAGAVGVTIAGGGGERWWNGLELLTNRAGVDFGTIGGGARNWIQNGGLGGGTIAGGWNNAIHCAAAAATVGGGDGNTVENNAYYGTISGGRFNTIQPLGGYNTIGGGVRQLVMSNTALATISGGGGNTINAGATFATIPGGSYAQARSYGQMAFASGSFAGASTGDAQSSLYVLRNVTTNTTPTELFLDGTAARMQVPTDSMWTFDILVAGRTQLLNPPDSRVISGAYHIRGVILRQGDATQLLSSTNTVLHADIPAWSASAVADDTHQALIIRVVGGAGDAPVRWVASVRTAEVVFP